ncbi:hypothetical protein [Fulvivirga lutea]|uniref:Uncharacterized protein n=1 Tax=Fulvivirga lutea TaxID=2810512 RepID=A0A974WDT3_9BACT|nr:hypothetical protein [Fulvivirga lutea]QSE96061.1 hypothetical protein JR347_10580 [Fulvivirga lutea]
MISENSQRIFESEGYSILVKGSSVYITSKKVATGISLVAFIALLIAIPLTLITLNGAFALLAAFLSLYPGYKLLKQTEIPNSITINNHDNVISFYKIYGSFTKTFKLNEVKDMSISTFEEFQDSNAFNDGVSHTHYFIDLETTSKTYTLLRFEDTELAQVQNILSELKAALGLKYLNKKAAA